MVITHVSYGNTGHARGIDFVKSLFATDYQ